MVQNLDQEGKTLKISRVSSDPIYPCFGVLAVSQKFYPELNHAKKLMVEKHRIKGHC